MTRCEIPDFDQFIWEAVEENQDWLDGRNFAKGQWAQCMFQFVRRCRFHPLLQGMAPEQAAELVEASLLRHPERETDDPWEIFDSTNSEPSYDAFVDLWFKVDRPIELDDPVKEAVRRADASPTIRPPTTKTRNSRAVFYRFISIANHLQVLLGPDQPIALPVERLGETLGVTRQRVGQMRSNAVRLGILIPESEYKRPGKGAGVASTYLFDSSKLSTLSS